MKSIIKLITLIGAAMLLPFLANAQMTDGTVRVFSVQGDVQLTDATGKTQPLTRGMTFTQGSSVRTGVNSTALLLFSNGSVVNVAAESTFRVDEFQQAAFDKSKGTYIRLAGDPSTSKTDLFLENGQVAGQVKKLQAQSSYNVNTPAGSAGIRGTDYVVTVVLDNDGNAITTITNVQGDVVALVQGVPFADVGPGQSITINATRSVNPQTGQVTFNVTQTGTPRPATQAEIEAGTDAVQQIQNAIDSGDIPGEVGPEGAGPDDGITPEFDVNPDINISPAGG